MILESKLTRREALKRGAGLAGMLAFGKLFTACADDGSKKHSPEITSNPVTEVNEGQIYNSKITATDEDNAELEYKINKAPLWLSMEERSDGIYITGMAPQVSADTPNPVEVEVSDGKRTDKQEYTLTVKDVPEPVNHAPTAFLSEPDFGDGLSGTYFVTVGGDDEDGDGIEVYARFNGEEWNFYDNGQTIERPIVEGQNTIESKVIDEFGNESEIVMKSFYSPTEEEAREKIEEILNATSNGGIIEDDNFRNTGIMVDYAIEPQPSVPSGDVIIEYIGENDNLTQEMNDKEYFDANNIPNLYMNKLPVTEIELRVNKFIQDIWQ
ncbi:hypothetical protein HYT25_02395 [Candidatus Pacearchaeota archaeon]|nr:hypothetical protein [Candidatus Pacearchaeota archaeon]